MTVSIRVGDCRELLRAMPDESVQMVCTSPPYFGLRDYGTASWSGGDPACDHRQSNYDRGVLTDASMRTDGGGASAATADKRRTPYRSECGKCGATRIDRQIGLEATLGEYLDTMVEVFREVRRVLHRTGTCWVNMGDSYASGGAKQTGRNDGGRPERNGGFRNGRWTEGRWTEKTYEIERTHAGTTPGLKPKDLMLVPHRLAIALQDDGWWVRSDIIWHKKAPMPESVCDRPTSAHEHIFLLAKAPKYFYDAAAVAEEGTGRSAGNVNQIKGAGKGDPFFRTREGFLAVADKEWHSRNQRNVWHLGPSPFPDAHFAVFPTEVPRRCIAAGTSERGQCPACGVPWARVVETLVKAGHKPRLDEERFKGGSGPHASSVIAFRGWQPGCRCDAGEPVPQTVLDPFAGACTTGLVADRMGRHAILLELSADYARMGEARIRGDAPMFANVEVAS